MVLMMTWYMERRSMIINKVLLARLFRQDLHRIIDKRTEQTNYRWLNDKQTKKMDIKHKEVWRG